jgi:hypothetical protein
LAEPSFGDLLAATDDIPCFLAKCKQPIEASSGGELNERTYQLEENLAEYAAVSTSYRGPTDYSSFDFLSAGLGFDGV